MALEVPPSWYAWREGKKCRVSAMTDLGYCEEQTVRQLRTYVPRAESRNNKSERDR